ncbi:uncharacterized protein LOC107270818 isoform X2 [Cephus cinctus]|uniref:Uncharacterized protein LOC107270818 isoform X2 n=1 Tax=Cephus cinctus TaxID=211228 RepID=A0AAJ7RND8_CEPCN|nr:uncharacterized protein LOC107270818 isoform X2 [Cephus cinctus]
MLPTQSEKFLCPMCNGTGVCGKDKVPTNYVKPTLRLPPMSLQSINSSSISKNEAVQISQFNAAGDVHLPSLPHIKSKESNFTGIMGDYSITVEHDLLGPLERINNPHEVLRQSIAKLKQNQWESSTEAILDIIQISRYYPEMLDPNMSLINRSLCSLMRNTRPHIVRTASKVAMELFETIKCTQRPEFDELVAILLQKTAHMNKSVRHDVNKALDTMIVHIPVSHCTRAITSAAGHKNPLVRSTVSRLLITIVELIGVDSFFLSLHLKDTRRKIFVVLAKFIIDETMQKHLLSC